MELCDTIKPGKEYTATIKGKGRSLDANAYAWVLLDKLAAFRGMGLWALRLSFTTENAGEVDKVLADWVRGGTFEPGSYTRGLYQRGVE